MGVHDCGRGFRVRRRWEGSPGWVAPGSKSEGHSETGRESADASEGPEGGLGKEKLFTAHPQPVVQGVQPAPTPPHTLDFTQLSPCSFLGFLWALSTVPSVTQFSHPINSLCAPPPPRAPSPSLWSCLGGGVGIESRCQGRGSKVAAEERGVQGH